MITCYLATLSRYTHADSMKYYTESSLQAFHTFHINAYCQHLLEVHSVDDIRQVYANTDTKHLPKLILGRGSNVLFTQNFEGVVILNRLCGVDIKETEQAYFIHIAGGEDWPNLVELLVNKGIGGLENLALIPGCAGSAPIQNIGAYGIEFKDVCEYVDYLDLDTMLHHRLLASECQFDYRDSIFKQSLKGKAFITAVGIKLTKQWQAKVHYGALETLVTKPYTPKTIFDAVCKVRNEKLPNPEVTGNAGSFFKNPLISNEKFAQLKQEFPNIVGYPNEEQVKLAAGWLIDKAGLKGKQIGGAQVNPKQALVLCNQNNATTQDVIQLAGYVRDQVNALFGVDLEHEVRFIGAEQETSLQKVYP